MKQVTILISIVLFVFFFSCNDKSGKAGRKNALKEMSKEVALSHAELFKIEKAGDVTKLSILKKGDENNFDTFNLVKTDEEKTHFPNAIKVPCKRIVCLSSTQLTYFFALDDFEDIVAINSSRYLHHEGITERVKAGKVKKIGKEGNFNLEMVAALDPDVIFVSPFKVGGFDVLRNLGIPLVPMAAYNEETPLGRAEWVKMLSLFVGQEEKADSLFDGIETRYQNLKTLASTVEKRPTVFSGKMRSGSWYVPGGDSFYAHYFRDAGAEYIIKDSVQGAYPVDFETIYSKAFMCDYWRIVHPEKAGFTMNDLLDQDQRYADFNAFKNKNVLFCNIRKKPYYEQAGMKPEVLLADYIYYFHPDLLIDYEPYFYEKLK